MLRTNQKNFEDEELPHESFLTIRQTTKIRNAFANSISTYTVFLEWPTTFLSEHRKDDWDQGVAEPPLKTPIEGPGSKL